MSDKSFVNSKLNKKIIISFTSYPDRIVTIKEILDHIINQTISPDSIVLCLSSEEFNHYRDMPNLTEYYKYGLEICWCNENLGPHKKYYYTMQRFPNDIIITIDDDICYKDTMIEELLFYHKKYPRAIIARRGHLISCQEDGKIAPYDKWYIDCCRCGVPRMDILANGCGGVLYPPNILSPEIFNKKIFMEKAPYADDMWLKIVELLSSVPVVLASPFYTDEELPCSYNGLYRNQNSNGGNDMQLSNLLQIYNNSCSKDRSLTDSLFSDGKILYTDRDTEKKKDLKKIMIVFLEKFLKEKYICIYGAGKVAKRLYKALEEVGYTQKIKAFIVSNTENNVKDIGGIPVKHYMDFVKQSEKIVIGLWETKQKKILSDLISSGVKVERIIKIPYDVNKAMEYLYDGNVHKKWSSSAQYWEDRYRGGKFGRRII